MEKQTRFQPQEYTAVPVCKAFQKRTASRFQHDSSPEGDAPIKIQRLRNPTFPKIHSLKQGEGEKQERNIKMV